MPTRFIVVLSDVHIGTNTPTNWYQASIHGPYVEAVLSYLSEFSEQVREIVLLGDIIDLWTYLPSQAPATAQAVFAAPANQAVFELVRGLVDDVDTVSFVAGNHDMTVTAGDLQALAGPRTGRVPKVQTAPYRPLGTSELLCAHGHEFSMMCAPYVNSKNAIAPLPIGYYATRAGAFYAYEQVKSRGVQNVAQLPDTGEPTGMNLTMGDVLSIMTDVVFENVGYAIMSAIQHATGLGWYTDIVMPDGRKSRSLDAADQDFSGLFDSFAGRKGPDGKVLGDAGAWEALLLPDVRNDLTSYASQLADTEDARLVVFGHTHVPKENDKLRILDSGGSATPTPFVYANSGFNCPSVPDMTGTGKTPTFVSIGIDEATGRVESVEHRNVRRTEGGTYEVSSGALLGPLSFASTGIVDGSAVARLGRCSG